MSNLLMLAGGIVERGGGRPGAVSAYVALHAVGASRLFKLEGSTDAPRITELDAATTVDLARFQRELAEDLAPALAEIQGQGGPAAIAQPKTEWVTELVERFLGSRAGV